MEKFQEITLVHFLKVNKENVLTLVSKAHLITCKKIIGQTLHLSDSHVVSKIIYRAPQSFAASHIQYNNA
jgi:hypothetical protein